MQVSKYLHDFYLINKNEKEKKRTYSDVFQALSLMTLRTSAALILEVKVRPCVMIGSPSLPGQQSTETWPTSKHRATTWTLLPPQDIGICLMILTTTHSYSESKKDNC